MASSNRHWPSMFKSKPCNTPHPQWQHDINPSLVSSTSHRPPYSSVGGCEERSPEPKPRWNPKPEQIRILEAIFNSGMVNPPRDEIRKIRAQLQEYGQVGDANVFYWFQNRKSRSKHKQRQLQAAKTQPQQAPQLTSAATPPSPLSSSTSTMSTDKPFSMGSPNVIDVWNPRTAPVNQTYLQTTQGDFSPEPFFFPVQQTTGETTPSSVFTQAFCSPELQNAVHLPDQTVGTCSGLLLNDFMMNHGPSTKKADHDKLKLQHHLGNTVSTAAPAATHTIVPPTTTLSVSSTINHVQGVGELGAVGPANPAKSTVFINDVAFEVGARPFNVREVFGDDAVLFHSSGQPVLVNEWGLTLYPLQHGAFYYLVRTLTP